MSKPLSRTIRPGEPSSGVIRPVMPKLGRLICAALTRTSSCPGAAAGSYFTRMPEAATFSAPGTSTTSDCASISNLPVVRKALVIEALPPIRPSTSTATSNFTIRPEISAVMPLWLWAEPCVVPAPARLPKARPALSAPMPMVTTSSPSLKPSLAMPSVGASMLTGPRAIAVLACAAVCSVVETVNTSVVVSISTGVPFTLIAPLWNVSRTSPAVNSWLFCAPGLAPR